VALHSVLVAAPAKDPFISELVRLLQSNNGQVLVSHDSESALRIARNDHPDVIVLDTVLQDGDGLLLCRQLKTDPATAAIPVFFFSVLMARDRCLEVGADGFMLKPVEQGLLMERIREVVQARVVRRLPRLP
jgi:DNA-binding response OmpR family regulator